MIDWRAFDAALERRAPTLWWRDDDAVAASPALDRLLALADRAGAPLTLAAIPALACETLAEAINGRAVDVAVHGWRHANHAPPSEKKAEFRAHRPLEALAADAGRGKARIAALFGAQAVPLFVPPWNRMAEDLPERLAEIGFEAVSAFARRDVSARGLLRLDAHIDPIDWRGSRSAVSGQALADHVTGLLASDAPIGLMTHHLVHDEAVWELTEALVLRLTRAGAEWVSARALIDGAAGAARKTPLRCRDG